MDPVVVLDVLKVLVLELVCEEKAVIHYSNLLLLLLLLLIFSIPFMFGTIILV